MAHPYKGQTSNKVTTMLAKIGENKPVGPQGSMQHKDQSSATGYKKGGRVKTMVGGVIGKSASKLLSSAGAGNASSAPASSKSYPISRAAGGGGGRLQKAHRSKK